MTDSSGEDGAPAALGGAVADQDRERWGVLRQLRSLVRAWRAVRRPDRADGDR